MRLITLILFIFLSLLAEMSSAITYEAAQGTQRRTAEDYKQLAANTPKHSGNVVRFSALMGSPGPAVADTKAAYDAADKFAAEARELRAIEQRLQAEEKERRESEDKNRKEAERKEREADRNMFKIILALALLALIAGWFILRKESASK